MKKLLLFAAIPFLLISCEKEKILPLTDIPSEIPDYINTHFPETSIIQAVKDTDGFELTYDITLNGGYFLEFNRKKEVIDIDGISELPDSVIPEKILEFVTTNYEEYFITGWEEDKRNQQIKLDNGLELVFNMNGDFLRIDN
ncbi:MAG: hypothetical protein FD170_1741 [Bacteroidetes bacterium]|nr:MAG: hypothetical protein FD170_1741 [Bacteroidota bacterium]